MSKLPLTLFARIYLSIVVVIIASVWFTITVIDHYYAKEDFNIFVSDTSYVYESIREKVNSRSYASNDAIQIPPPYDRDFTAKFIKSVSKKACDKCELITAIDSVKYYQLEADYRMAEYILADTKGAVIIADKLDSERDGSDMADVNIDDMTYRLLIIIISLFIGITLYWPIKQLQQQIRQLIESHRQFGAGNMQVKAPEDLQKPLDELAQSFNNMAHSIAESVKESEIFAQSIPHEIRTPLSRIQLASGLIRRETNNEDHLQLLDNIDNYIVDINELISQIVEFSRLNTDRSSQLAGSDQSIEIKAFVEARLKIVALEQMNKFNLDINDSLGITTNPIYLRLMLDNLIKNAINHADSQINISAKSDNGRLVIIVEDDGVGIKSADRETVFIPFARLDKSRSRKTGGLGLGLPIAKAAARKMNGVILVSNSRLGGAKFSFKMSL